jgi:ubiquitin-activating enzyme E1 C
LQQQFKIEGVTGSLTQGVFKNVIPAIASNNAIIAASSCNEAFKIATSSAAYLNNYFMLIGTEGTYSYTFEHEKRDHCPVCGGEALEMSIMISRDWTVEQLIELLTEKQNIQIKKASLATPEKPIYFHQPPQLEEATRPNLEKRVSEPRISPLRSFPLSLSLPRNLAYRLMSSIRYLKYLRHSCVRSSTSQNHGAPVRSRWRRSMRGKGVWAGDDALRASGFERTRIL